MFRIALIVILVVSGTVQAQSMDLAAKHFAYTEKLRQDFGHYIHYENEQVRQAVQSFTLDCKTVDGRFVLLESYMLYSIKQVYKGWEQSKFGKEFQLTLEVKDIDGILFVIQHTTFGDNRTIDTPVLKMNPELGRIYFYRAQNLRRACNSSQAPIWMLREWL